MGTHWVYLLYILLMELLVRNDLVLVLGIIL